MIRKLQNLVSHIHSKNMMELRTVILSVLATGLLSTILLAYLDIDRPEMLALSTVFLAGIALAYLRFYKVGSWLTLLAALVTLSFFVYHNNGIRDTAMFGLIAVIIAAGLLAGQGGTLIVGILILLEVGILAGLEARGVIINQFSSQNFLADYISISISIAFITILQWTIIGRLNKHILNAEQELNERKKIEHQLRDAEARYRDLVEKIPLVVYISEPGTAGIWKYVSPQITELTGYSPQAWIDDPTLWFSRIHPDDRDKVIETETTALREGNMPRMEYRLQTSSGNYIWVYDESLLLVDADQSMLVQGFLLDITSRKLAEEQLQRRLAELQAVHGVSETLSHKTDLQKLIQETGDQIRLTFQASNVLIAIHDPITNLIHFPYDYEDNIPISDKPIRYGEGMTTRVMEGKQPIRINRNWLEKTAEMNAIYTSVIPIKSSASVPIMTTDQVIGAITVESTNREYAFTENDVRLLTTIAANLAVAIENTRLQESLKQELEKQEKLVHELEIKNEELERFVYTASHDLKSPLITIRGFLGYLERDAQVGNIDRLRGDIQRITDATNIMHRLLNELLELSKVGHVTKEKKDIPFEEIIHEALKRVEGQLKEKQVEVEVGSEFPIVHVDKERIIEVLQNLLDNAAKFMGDQSHPRIEINFKHEDEQCIFYVRDNGIGIKKEFHSRIFGLFDKLNSDSVGTGVGLALVKRIVEVHGGKIWVESKEGDGATFYFTLE